MPLGVAMTIIGRQYTGALSLALESCGADRYTSILLFLDYYGKPVKQQVLVEKLRIDKASMVRMLDYLAEKGLIQRTQNPSDRREFLLELSREGKKKLPKVKKAIMQTDEQIFKGLSATARKQFLEMLHRISENASVIPGKQVAVQFKVKMK